MSKLKAVAGETVALVKKLDESRDRVADRADTAAKASKLVAAGR
ncbi:hypothetical protein [Pseudomonas asiatica]|nr:hypothetical protein [Pseudomonas asiatica]